MPDFTDYRKEVTNSCPANKAFAAFSFPLAIMVN